MTKSNFKIPIFKPQNEFKNLDQIIKKINKQLELGVFIGGQSIELLEENLKTFLGVKYISTLNSGSDALYFALKSLDLDIDDEVILPSFTYYATLSAVLRLGLKPIFVDIDENNYCISLDTVKKSITKKTKCIIPVNLFGYSSDIENISKFCKENKIFMIEDNAQAFGSKHSNNQFLGTFGDVNAFSNYPTKTLGGIGDGGFIATNNKKLYEKINIFKNQGQSMPYKHIAIGYNSRLDSINAIVLNEKLKSFEKMSQSRQELYNFYEKLFLNSSIVKYKKIEKDKTLLNYFTITLPYRMRDKFQKELSNVGIQTMIYYKTPLHKQPIMKGTAFNLPTTDKVAKSVLSLPFYPYIKKNELQYLNSNIRTLLNKFE